MNKGKFLIMGLLGFLLVFGMVLASCDNKTMPDTTPPYASTPYGSVADDPEDGLISTLSPGGPSGPSGPGGPGGPGGSYTPAPLLTGNDLLEAKEEVGSAYSEAGGQWSTMVAQINAAYPGINLPNSNPSTWTAQQISDAYYYGQILFGYGDDS